MHGTRLRQAVVVAADLERALEDLRRVVPLGEPFHDPAVVAFGLRNAVCALGDGFVEVVSPLRDGTAAGRHLARRGDGGYMLLVQVPDIAAARARARGAGIRAVWGIDLPDMAATHLHPADAGGTILSIDQPVPPDGWRWAGPGRRPGPGALRGATVEVPDPSGVAARWAAVLGLPVPAEPVLRLDGTTIRFEPGDGGLAALAVEAPGAQAGTAIAAGIRIETRASAPADAAEAL